MLFLRFFCPFRLNRSSIGKGCHPTEAARTEVESTFAESAEYLAGRHLTVIPGLTDEADAAAGRIARETRLRLDRLAELLWDVAQRQDHGCGSFCRGNATYA